MRMSRTPSVISSITAQQSVASHIDPSRVAQLVLQLAERAKENSELHRSVQQLSAELADTKTKLLEEKHSVERLTQDVEALPAILKKNEEYKEKLKSLKKAKKHECDSKDELIANLKSSVESMDAELTALRERYRQDTGDITLKLRRIEAEHGELLTDHEQLKLKYELLQRRKEEDVWHNDRERERARRANVTAQGTQVEPVTVTKLLQTDETQVRSVGEQCDILAVSRGTPVAGGGAAAVISTPKRSAAAQHRSQLDITSRHGGAAANDESHHQSDSLAGILHTHPHLRGALEGEGVGDEDVAQSELVHRYYMEKQIKIHDKLLSAVSSLQREASKATRVPAPF